MDAWLSNLVVLPVVAVGAYLWLIFVLRLSGKRSLSKLNAFDFAMTVAIGSALATIIIDRSVGLFRGAVALAMLALLQYVLTKLSLWSPFVRKTVRSSPTLLVRDGKLFDEAMYYERVTTDELAEAIRNNGHGRLEEIGAVILETDGSFSVIPRSQQNYDLLYDVRMIGEPSKEPIEQRRQREVEGR